MLSKPICSTCGGSHPTEMHNVLATEKKGNNLIEVEFPENFDIEEQRKECRPLEVAKEYLDNKPDRVEITGGHIMMNYCQLDDGSVICLPMIFSDIPTSAREIKGQADTSIIIAEYEIPIQDEKGHWIIDKITREFSEEEVEDGKLAAKIAKLTAAKDSGLKKFRTNCQNDPSVNFYPVHSFIQSLQIYKECREKMDRKKISFSTVVNDWQKLDLNIDDPETRSKFLAAREAFWKEFDIADLTTFQTIADNMGLQGFTTNLISEKRLRNRIGHYFSKLAEKQDLSHIGSDDQPVYGFRDKTSGEELKFGVCGVGACNSEVMELVNELIVKKTKESTEGVLMVNFVPEVCSGWVDNGSKYGLKFSVLRRDAQLEHQKRQIKERKRESLPFPERIKILNFYTTGLAHDESLSRLNGQKQTSGRNRNDLYSVISSR